MSSSLSPSSAPVGGGAFTLSLLGTGFRIGRRRDLGRQRPDDDLRRATRLDAAIPASDLASGKAVPIVAQMTGAGVSNSLDFTSTTPLPR